MGLPKWVAPAVGCPYSPTGMKTAKRLVRGASPTGEEKGCRAIASELAVTKYIDAMPLIFNLLPSEFPFLKRSEAKLGRG
ncbi:hypothetical protein H6F96_10855 [Microcoleus sp. FACHB-53]|nr:hypothetical protein [Microcoleus sp. FACHB-53]MBD2126701.1 hypothetical protein [Microcoleus sp. FACHB-1]